MARLRWKCTGTPAATDKHHYPMEYSVRDKIGKWHIQCDCTVIVTLQRAETRVIAELEVKTSFVDLFGIDSSQSQDDPLSPPPRCRKRKLEERHKVYDKNKSDDDNGGGGKQGGRYGDSSRGGGKRKSAI